MFPPGLEYAGFNSGEADLALEVDRDGHLVDCLAVAYTRMEFAAAALQAVHAWRFDPIGEGGLRSGWVAEVKLDFRVDGIRVVVDNPEHPAGKLKILTPDDTRFAYHAYRPSELDRMPQLVHFVPPSSSAPGVARVEFYVDPQGRVRLPGIVQASNAEVGAAALAAVRQWQFEPPLRGGRPVLIRVTQELRFGARRATVPADQ